MNVFLNLTIDYTKKNWHMILLLYTAYLHDYCNISLRCTILHCKFYLAPAWINEKIMILIDWLSKIQISNFIEYQLFFILIVSCKIWRKYCLYTSRNLTGFLLYIHMMKSIPNKVYFLLKVHTFSWKNPFLKEGFNSLYLISNNKWNLKQYW